VALNDIGISFTPSTTDQHEVDFHVLYKQLDGTLVNGILYINPFTFSLSKIERVCLFRTVNTGLIVMKVCPTLLPEVSFLVNW